MAAESQVLERRKTRQSIETGRAKAEQDRLGATLALTVLASKAWPTEVEDPMRNGKLPKYVM